MLQSYELSLPKILKVMRLSELKTGEKGVIVKVLGHGGFRKRIVAENFESYAFVRIRNRRKRCHR